MDVTERIADRADPFADAKVVGVAERRFGQRPLSPLTWISATSMAGIGADHFAAQRAAVRQRDRDPIGVFDDVEIGQDEALRGR